MFLSPLLWIDLISDEKRPLFIRRANFFFFIVAFLASIKTIQTKSAASVRNCVKMNLIVKSLNIVNEYSSCLLLYCLFTFSVRFQWKHSVMKWQRLTISAWALLNWASESVLNWTIFLFFLLAKCLPLQNIPFKKMSLCKFIPFEFLCPKIRPNVNREHK